MGFTALDYTVLFAYLVVTASLGVWLGRGQQNVRDYFLGGKSLPWWAISFSIVATETSTLTFIGAPAIAYEGGLFFIQLALGYILGKLLVSFLLIPAYFRGEIQSAYEILRLRFGGRARDFSALVFQLNRALADGVRLFATALVLSVVTQISDVRTVIIIGIVTIIYTFYGGFVAVVWNDVIQLFIYVGGALLAAFLLLDKIPGGWAEVVSTAGTHGKLHFLDFSLDWTNPYTFWAGMIGGGFLTFATHGTDQMMVQRYLSCKARRDSQVALIASGFVVLAQFLLFLLIGVMLFVFYNHFPLGRALDQPNRIFPIFIVEEMPAGVSGLIIAAIFAAAMSTLSSSLNSLASSSVHDFYKPYLVPAASDRHYLQASRVFTVVWGLVLIGVSMLARNWGEVLQVGLTITGIVMGGVLGVFLLGAWTRRTAQTGALFGMASGLLVTLAVHWTGTVAWTWYVMIGTASTFAAGSMATLVERSRDD